MRHLFGISDFNPFFITKLITNNKPTRALTYVCLRSDKQALPKLWLVIVILKLHLNFHFKINLLQYSLAM